MNSGPIIGSFLARLSGLLVVVLCGSLAAAQQADPPERVGRLNHTEGTVTFSPADDNEWIDVQPNRPLTRGDRLWTDRGSRAEVQVGSSALRLDGQTHLEILALDDRSTQLSLTQGTLYVRVRNLPDGENFEIDTPNLAYRAAYPGDYRIDVNAIDGTTRVTIHSGAGIVYGEGGHSLPLGGGQQVSFRARTLSQVAAQESPPQDAFDRWAAERNRREDQSISARHVPREVVGYQQLDAHGQWKREAAHGAVWYPQGTPANWAPYRNGHWEWIGPWGWTWIDDAPWGFAPFHYGRWTLIDSRWAWVPGRLGARPVYAPALVAFVGNKGGGVLKSAAGRSGVAWFPLAPGEMWQPGFRASVGYISNVNRHMVPGSSEATYVYQRRPEALTAISGEDFHRGRPAGVSWWRIAADTLTSAGIVPPPPMPDRTAVAARDKAKTPRAAPTPQPDLRQVAAAAAASQPGDSAPRNGGAAPRRSSASEAALQQREATQRAEQTRVAQQARIEQAQAEKVRVAEQAKAAQQTKLEQIQAEKARQAEQAKVAEQARLAELARRAEQAEQSKQAAVERARVAQQAKAAAKAQLEQQRKLTEQARSTARTERAELARPQVLAQQARQASRVQEAASRADAARREQQAKRADTGKRPTSVARAESPRRNTAQFTQRGRPEAVATRTEQTRHQQSAKRELQAAAKQAELARRQAAAKRKEQLQARRAEQLRREADAKRDEEHQRIAHAQRVEQSRRIAERDAQVLRERREQREEQARREEEREYAQRDRELARREAWQRQQQAIADQWRREAWEQQQRERARSRPEPRERPPEVWQRGIPILNPGRTS